MYIILIFLLIILVLYFIYKFYPSNFKNLDDRVIHPSDYYVFESKTFKNKFEHSEKMLRSIGAKDQLINKLKNIRKKIGKNIVYGIKNKDGNYRIEIYLYSKNINEKNYINVNYSQFKKELDIILNEFST